MLAEYRAVNKPNFKENALDLMAAAMRSSYLLGGGQLNFLFNRAFQALKVVRILVDGSVISHGLGEEVLDVPYPGGISGVCAQDLRDVAFIL